MLPLEKLSTLILVVLFTVSQTKGASRQRLEFYAGEYKNISVALNSEIDSSTCSTLITEIQNVVSSASSKLFAATGGKAFFGHVKILIPRGWNPVACGLRFSKATAADSYEDAVIKVTGNHPIAKSLPWTRQYRGCGQSSDDIIIPPSFFLLSSLGTNIKAQLMLHEWAKFRYGVYEEHAYFGDENYPACYSREGRSELSSCSNVALNSVANTTNISAAICQSQINAQATALLSQLSLGASSIMSMPHLENVSTFCTNQTHNKLAATKHNALCNRQSVENVINSHPDMISGGRMKSKQIETITQFEFLQHETDYYPPGYAFVIEDSVAIRSESRIRQMKQAIVQMVDQMRIGTMVAIFTFAGSVTCSMSPSFTLIIGDENKKEFISRLPDMDTSPCSARLSPTIAKQAEGDNNIYFALREVISSLNSRASNKWNIFLITSSTSTGFEAARNELDDYGHSLSILTFDNTEGWLNMYQASNLRNIIVLPNCFVNGRICSTRSSAFAMDEFVEVLRSEDSPQFLQKVAEVDLQKGAQTTFNVDVDITPSSITGFYVYLSGLNSTLRITSPNGTPCPMVKVLDYAYSMKLDSTITGCGFQTGTWHVDLSVLPASEAKHTVQVFVKSSASNSQFFIHGSIGEERQTKLSPNSSLTAVFARVTDTLDRPIINAQVELKNFWPSNQLGNLQTSILQDNGLDPDLIKNDGVYSAYMTDYSPDASYHIPQLTVTTNFQAKVVDSLASENEYSAALLDPSFNSKCCGSGVPISSLLETSVGNARYTSMIPGFVTITGFSSSNLPPSKIGMVRVIGDDENTVTLQFIAPFAIIGGTGSLIHYESCCTVKDEAEDICLAIIPPSNCLPVEGGQTQICVIDRESIAKNYLGNNSSAVFLNCGIRGINQNSIAGKISSNSFQVYINPNKNESSDATPRELKCDSLSDDCLPIVVFWGLIGCIGGLVLVILALLICWCWTYRKRKAATNGREEVLMKMSRGDAQILPDKDSPLYNVYVNKAYIQETDGQMKLVASEGELLPLDSNENNAAGIGSRPHHPIPSVRRRSVSVSADIGIENNQSGLQSYNSDMADMRLYKTHLSKPVPPPQKPSTFFNATRSEENLSVPVPRNRLPRMESTAYANSNVKVPNKMDVPTISSSIQDNHRELPELPVYASVNRNGRRGVGANANYPVQPIASVINNNNSIFPKPKPTPKYDMSRSSDDDQRNVPEPMPIQNRFSRPLSAYTQSHRPEDRRPISSSRLDAFPSSDSDSYSDMSRGIPIVPKPPPVPPPFPKTSETHNPAFRRNTPTRHNIQPKTVTRTPPRDTSTSRGVNSKSPAGPPPPPPPRQQLQNQQMQPNYPVSTNRQLSDDDYDDDSEHWDDDDFEFNPGETHA